jgi:hypothetical protein
MPFWRRAGPILLIAVGLFACQPSVSIPATVYTPTIAGVVATTTQGPGRTNVYTLADGTSVTIDYAVTKALDGSGNGSVGDLLLTDDSSAFMSSLRIDPNPDLRPGCFGLRENGVDDGDHIKIANGLRLPKAADFDQGQAHDGVYQIPLHAFCVDDIGEVTLYH